MLPRRFSVDLGTAAIKKWFHAPQNPSIRVLAAGCSLSSYLGRSNFGSKGSVSGLPRSGRPHSVRDEGVFPRVKVRIEEGPSASTRKRFPQVSNSSDIKIFKCINLFPYTMMEEEFMQQWPKPSFSCKFKKKNSRGCEHKLATMFLGSDKP